MRRINGKRTEKKTNWRALGIAALAAIGMLSGCGAQAAETIYVSSSGSGENSGTDRENPVASITLAQELAGQGGTVILLDTCYVSAETSCELSGFTVSMADTAEGPLFEVLQGGSLTLNNIVINGSQTCLLRNAGELYIDDSVTFFDGEQELTAAEAIETASGAVTFSGGAQIETAVWELQTDASAGTQSGTDSQSADQTQVEPVVNETVTAIEEELNSLSIRSKSDSQALVSLYNRYQALTAAEKAGVSQEAKERLDAAVEQAGTYNHTDNNVMVTGDLPWYVQLQATIPENAQEVTESGDLILSYDLSLWDLYTGTEYHLEGQTVTVSVPRPNIQVDGSIRILHYKSDGTTEVLETTQEGSRLYFETSSFSQFSLVTDTLVGVNPETMVSREETESSQSQDSGASGNAAGGTQTGISTVPAQTEDSTLIWPLAGAAFLALLTAAGAVRAGRG